MPAISIITPLFNKRDYIAQTIESAQRQSICDWEMIVVENSSTDGGADIVREMATQDARIRCIEISNSTGPGAARNQGLKQATGEWVLFLDADDLLLPDYLAEQLEACACIPDPNVIVGCWQEFSDAAPERFDLKQPTGYRTNAETVAAAAIAYAPWAVHAAIVRRSHLVPHRCWNEDLDGWPSEDTAFWFRVITGASIVWSNSRGALYRVATPNSRNTGVDSSCWVEAVSRIVDANIASLQRFGLTPSSAQTETIMRVFEDHYRKAMRKGHSESAEKALEHANRWLDQCPFSSGPIFLRKLLGIVLSSRLAAWNLQIKHRLSHLVSPQ